MGCRKHDPPIDHPKAHPDRGRLSYNFAMRFVSWPESELQIRREDVEAVFEPFVQKTVEEHDPAWRAPVRKQKKKIARAYLRRRLLGWLPTHQRHESSIVDEYSQVWNSIDYSAYTLTSPAPSFKPWEWGGRRMFASTFGATRVRQLLMIRLIEELEPARVLEVGSGNGINLMLLACRFPEIEFTGVDLTVEGPRAARELQKEPTLPTAMQEFAPLPLADPTAFRRVRFVRGSAACLPLADESVDLVNTVLALEQMEQIRTQALREIARVTRRHAFMIEPFRDVNDRGWPRANVIRRDYFRGRIEDLRQYGLEPRLALHDFPQEEFLKVCAVLSERRR
jgi:ubiquinone/menaquinone biosynthesis C-methylase UbiE